MAVFTSAYKALAHLAPNWDTQLRSDMNLLEINLNQSTWTPSFTGPSASSGSGTSFIGNTQRLGLTVKYNASLVLGTSATFGNGTINLGGFNAFGSMAPQISVGRGIYIPSGGGIIRQVELVALDGSSFNCYVVTSSGLADMNTLGTPANLSQIRFTADCVLST